jgi:hypothetical protein
MSAATLLSRLAARRIFVWLDGDRLRWEAPKGALSPEDLAELRAHKAELLELLRARQSAALEHLRGYQQEARAFLGAVQVRPALLHQAYAADCIERGHEQLTLEAFAQELRTSAPELLEERPPRGLGGGLQSAVRSASREPEPSSDRPRPVAEKSPWLDRQPDAPRKPSPQSLPEADAGLSTSRPSPFPSRGSRRSCGPIQLVETLAPLLFHQDDRGFFDVPAGSRGVLVEDLAGAVEDLTERERLEGLVRRERTSGADPVPVQLDGAIRVLERRQVRLVPPGQPDVAPPGAERFSPSVVSAGVVQVLVSGGLGAPGLQSRQRTRGAAERGSSGAGAVQRPWPERGKVLSIEAARIWQRTVSGRWAGEVHDLAAGAPALWLPLRRALQFEGLHPIRAAYWTWLLLRRGLGQEVAV